MKQLLPIVWLTLMLLGRVESKAQTTIATGLTASTTTTGPTITFAIQNSNNYPIIITQISNFHNTANNGKTYTLWYSGTQLTGTPTIASPNWIQVITGSPISLTASGLTPVLTGMNLTIPANTTYRVALLVNSGNIYYSGTTSSNTYTSGGITLITGTHTTNTWVGAFPTPGISGRWFCGSITFMPGSANNLQGVAIVQPNNLSQVCGNTTPMIRMVIKNTGSAPQSNFPLGIFYSGTVAGSTVVNSGTLNEVYTKILAPNATDTVNMGILNFTPGSYSMVGYTMLNTDTLRNNDTTPTVNFVIKTPVAAPNVVSDTVCSGGNASLLVRAQPNTVFKWYSFPSGGPVVNVGNALAFNNLVRDTILFVSATFDNCESGRKMISAAIGPKPVVNLGNDTSFCESLPMILDAGNPGGKYTWSTGDSTQTITLTNKSGNYWVVVNRYCTSSDTIAVNISPLPRVSGISYVRSGNSYHFSASSIRNVTEFLWIFGDGTTSSSPTPTHTFRPGINVNLAVRLIVANECGSDTVKRTVPTGIEESILLSDKINIYPNPAKDVLYVNADGVGAMDVFVINSLGNLMLRHVLNHGNNEVELSSLPSGNYYLRMSTDKGSIVKPFVILR